MKIFVKNNDVGKALRIMKKKLLAEGSYERSYVKTLSLDLKVRKKRLAEKAGKKRWEKKRLQLEQKIYT